ncbi:MAG TPA: hypothetical protein VFP50_15495 [Anaeromyxobacteraceae bacterium]|nr:hypothetical protein [Anaeromyxobacteraceae bacterium]
MSRTKIWSARIRFTEDELEVVLAALALWEATPAGGDISEEQADEYADACDSARHKVTAALPPRTA